MRTTLTLEADVLSLLESLTAERHISMKEAVNSSLRKGLQTAASLTPSGFEQETFALGATQMFRWDKALATADAMEDEEIARKIASGK